jgi:hypothetical protein
MKLGHAILFAEVVALLAVAIAATAGWSLASLVLVLFGAFYAVFGLGVLIRLCTNRPSTRSK